MTNEEARWFLENIPQGSLTLIEFDALDMAYDALEKQIPMKPTKEFNCPRCGLDVLGDGQFVEYMQFCSNCGQAIDWSDSE